MNVTTAMRQPGSTVKPFTCSAALELGMTPGDIIWDTPANISGYQPVNVPITSASMVRCGCAPPRQLVQHPGCANSAPDRCRKLIAIMRRFGIDSIEPDPSRYGLSLTLGGGDVTLLEMTRGFSVFANGVRWCPPRPSCA
ncbi:MAG: hypothetical protein U0452_12005 [Anaerolineae bacterium]